jgi:catechol 2,3-dioxygenase-like lactoylglutathione lyase family enzyme
MSDLPRFGRAAPTIAVADIDAALSFYTGVLGFHVTFTNGEPPHFAIVERDDAELHLTLAPEHRSDDVNVAHLLVEDARALHDHVVAHGVAIVEDLRDSDYDMRGFVMADPDGNRIDVGEDLNA